MNATSWIFLILVVNQLLGTTTFIWIYRRSDWRSSSIGRHLMFYSVSAGGLDLTWALLATARWDWLPYLLFIAQTTFGLLTWQRVWLVRRTQGDEEI